METDHQRILNWLSDGQWHCSTELDYMRDARKRISELNKPEVRIDGISCDGRCGTTHKSKSLKMRRLMAFLSPSESFQVAETASPCVFTPEKVFNPIQEVISALKEQTALFQ